MTDWLTATAMLLSGLIVGFMFLYGMRRKGERADLERKDLEAKRDALIAELRAETDPVERARLEVEAASVLRKLARDVALSPERSEGPPAHLREGDPSLRSGSSAPGAGGQFKGFLWGAASVAVLAGMGFWVMNQAKPRENENQPMTGEVPQRPATAPDAEVQQLEAAVQKNPDDLNARNALAKAYLDRENIEGVVVHTQYVLKRNPDDARALTYEALVRVGIGQGDTALPMLERATKSDPQFLDAWVGLAWVHATANRMKEAGEAITTAKRLRPDQAARLDQLMAHITQPGAAAPAPGNGVIVSVSVAPNASIPQSGVLFVIARAAGVTAGPPIAVKRVLVRPFPFDVEVTSADSMTGQPLPETMNIDVRLDADGDAMTKTASDLRASQDRVKMGQKIALTLQ